MTDLKDYFCFSRSHFLGPISQKNSNKKNKRKMNDSKTCSKNDQKKLLETVLKKNKLCKR